MPFAKSAKTTPTYFCALPGALGFKSMPSPPKKTESLKAQLTVAAATAIMTSLLTGAVVHSQLSSEQEFAELMRQAEIRTRNLDKKLELLTDVTELVASIHQLRLESSLSRVSATIATVALQHDRYEFSEILDVESEKFESNCQKVEDGLTRLQAQLAQVQLLFGQTVQSQVTTFANSVMSKCLLPAANELELEQVPVPVTETIASDYFDKVREESLSDTFMIQTKLVLDQMNEELRSDIRDAGWLDQSKP